MVDSLDGLGTNNTIFSFSPDWKSNPKEEENIMVTTNIYSGTIHSLDFYRDPVKKLSYKITDLETKLYSFLVFFADRIGRLKSFWLPDIGYRFVPMSIDVNPLLYTLLRVEKVADFYFQGHERLYIQMSNGDRITRKIESVVQATASTEITVATEFPTIDVADIEACSLIYYCRFDQDEIEITYHTDQIASVDISFIELANEVQASWV